MSPRFNWLIISVVAIGATGVAWAATSGYLDYTYSSSSTPTIKATATGNAFAIKAYSATSSDDEGGLRAESTNTGSHNTVGVWGIVNAKGTSAGQPIGVRGDAKASSNTSGSFGVLGYNYAKSGGGGAGVWGGSVGTPGSEGAYSGLGHGVQGETYGKTTGSSGVFGVARASSGTTLGVYGQTTSTSGYGVFSAGPSGATGYKSAIVPVPGGAAELYAVEATEVWFQDFGHAALENGAVAVALDPEFLDTVTIDDPNSYHVFVQVNGPAQVYVEKGEDGFDVIQFGTGDRFAEFSYVVVAKRRNYENRRLEPADPALLRPIAAAHPGNL